MPKARFSQGESRSKDQGAKSAFFVDQDQMTFDDPIRQSSQDTLSYCGRGSAKSSERQTDVSSQSQFSISDTEKNADTEKSTFNFMEFARLVCNPKVLVTENKLLDKNDQVLAEFRKTKKVGF